MKVVLLSVLCFTMIGTPSSRASSTIVDGVVIKIDQKTGGSRVHTLYSPYCSARTMAELLTLKPGLTLMDLNNEASSQHHFKPYTEEEIKSLTRDRFDEDSGWFTPIWFPTGSFKGGKRSGGTEGNRLFYIDQTPVTREEFQKILRVGTQLAMMRNGGYHYIVANVRSRGSLVGFIEKASENKLVMGRRQTHKIIEAYRIGDDAYFPPNMYEFKVENDAQIVAGGTISPYDPSLLPAKTPALFQPARLKQRIELIPKEWSPLWPEIIKWKIPAENPDSPKHYMTWTSPDDPNEVVKASRKQMMKFGPYGSEYMSNHFAVATSDGLSPAGDRLIDTRHAKERGLAGNNQLTVDELKKLKPLKDRSLVYEAYLLAGGHEPLHTIITRGHYEKGAEVIMDGMYLPPNGKSFWKSAFAQGRPFVATNRRGRPRADKFFASSEVPMAWGEITKIDGDNVTVVMPKLDGVPSGEQTFEVNVDAEFVYLGQPIAKEDVLKVGSLLQVFAPHPQRILVNDGKDWSTMVNDNKKYLISE